MFYKKLNYNKPRELYEFIADHFEYYTLNSWNGLRSIANNVKLYNLHLKYDYMVAYNALCADEWKTVDYKIEEWELDHPDYQVGFNGSSSGYLVLYNKQDYRTVVDYYIDIASDWEDLKAMLKDQHWGTVKEFTKLILAPLARDIQSFDKLCDDLIDVVNELTEDYIKENKNNG